MILDRVSCIHFPLQFQKNKKTTIQTLINLDSKINAMTLAYTKRLGFWTQKTDVKAQNINESLLKTFRIIIAGFQIINKFDRIRFF